MRAGICMCASFSGRYDDICEICCVLTICVRGKPVEKLVQWSAWACCARRGLFPWVLPSLSPPPPIGALQSTAARPLLKWREQAARNSCRRLWALPPARLLLLRTRDAKLFAREPEAAERASSLPISAGQFSPLARRRAAEAASPLALLLHQVAG